MSVTSKVFGECDNSKIIEYSMENENGMKISVLNRGGIIRNIFVKDKFGKLEDVALALDAPEDYKRNSGYLGAAIGRYANRIEGSTFTLNGKRYNLNANVGTSCLHGGNVGYDKRIWDVEIGGSDSEPKLVLTLDSPDGEEGFPGNVHIVMTYTLTKENSIIINYQAVSDKDTPINLTNHTYFNLAGHKSGKIDEQTLKLNCNFFTPNNEQLVTFGEIWSVKGTPFDFTEEKTFGEGFSGNHEQIKMFDGFDHNFIIDDCGFRLFAVAKCKGNGICMNCYTNKPGVQLYTANTLNIKRGKDGARYGIHDAFCLETQYFPNSLKYSHFPSPVLKAGEKYNFTTEYKFYTE